MRGDREKVLQVIRGDEVKGDRARGDRANAKSGILFFLNNPIVSIVYH